MAQQALVFKKQACPAIPAAWRTGSTAISDACKMYSPALSTAPLALPLCLLEHGTWCIQEAEMANMGTRSPRWSKGFLAVGQEKPGPSDLLVLLVAASTDDHV